MVILSLLSTGLAGRQAPCSLGVYVGSEDPDLGPHTWHSTCFIQWAISSPHLIFFFFYLLVTLWAGGLSVVQLGTEHSSSDLPHSAFQVAGRSHIPAAHTSILKARHYWGFNFIQFLKVWWKSSRFHHQDSDVNANQPGSSVYFFPLAILGSLCLFSIILTSYLLDLFIIGSINCNVFCELFYLTVWDFFHV